LKVGNVGDRVRQRMKRITDGIVGKGTRIDLGWRRDNVMVERSGKEENEGGKGWKMLERDDKVSFYRGVLRCS
jgi:hypothetical protein